MQVIKDSGVFSETYTVLHSSHFLLLGKWMIKGISPLNKDLLLFIVKRDCKNMSANLNIHCVFSNLGNEWVLSVIIKEWEEEKEEETNMI